MKTSAWNMPASAETVAATASALQANGITAIVATSAGDAAQKVLEIIPEGAEVMTMTSATLEKLGLAEKLNTSGDYASVRAKLDEMKNDADAAHKRKLGSGPEWAVGSVHAVTEDGRVLIASATGSQLPAYAYGALHVVWVVGTQKIVKDLDAAFRRLEEHVFPLENARALKAYGAGSVIAKTLVVNKEVYPGRITIVFVPESVGF